MPKMKTPEPATKQTHGREDDVDGFDGVGLQQLVGSKQLDARAVITLMYDWIEKDKRGPILPLVQYLLQKGLVPVRQSSIFDRYHKFFRTLTAGLGHPVEDTVFDRHLRGVKEWNQYGAKRIQIWFTSKLDIIFVLHLRFTRNLFQVHHKKLLLEHMYLKLISCYLNI